MTDPNRSSLDSASAPFERRAAFAAWILSGGDLDPPYGPERERALCAPGRAAIALSRQLCPDQTRHLSDWAILSDEPVFDWLATHDLCTGQAALGTDWLVTYLLLGLARFPFIRELTPFDPANQLTFKGVLLGQAYCDSLGLSGGGTTPVDWTVP